VRDVCSAEGLTPLLRTDYKRTAFQNAANNAMRISIDTYLCFAACAKIPGASPPPAPQLLNRCYGDVEAPSGAAFPFAVMEIKLNGTEAPPWLVSLVRPDR